MPILLNQNYKLAKVQSKHDYIYYYGRYRLKHVVVNCYVIHPFIANKYSCVLTVLLSFSNLYQGADKSLARPTSRCILFDGENISFDASLVIYINSTNIPPIMIINRIYKHQNLLSL